MGFFRRLRRLAQKVWDSPIFEHVVQAGTEAAKPIVGDATDALRTELEQFLTDFAQKAHMTPNPIDDMLASFLCRIVGVKG